MNSVDRERNNVQITDGKKKQKSNYRATQQKIHLHYLNQYVINLNDYLHTDKVRLNMNHYNLIGGPWTTCVEMESRSKTS